MSTRKAKSKAKVKKHQQRQQNQQHFSAINAYQLKKINFFLQITLHHMFIFYLTLFFQLMLKLTYVFDKPSYLSYARLNGILFC